MPDFSNRANIVLMALHSALVGLSPPSSLSTPNPNLSPHHPLLHRTRRRLYTLSPLRHRSTAISRLLPIACSSSPSSPSEEESPESQPSTTELPPSSQPTTELGEEIRKVLEERREKKEGDLLSGVVEEIEEIEWPAFKKVLGTTGVVLGVIAGSSVVLLTVNAVLAELSDKVFAGRGIQDIFG